MAVNIVRRVTVTAPTESSARLVPGIHGVFRATVVSDGLINDRPLSDSALVNDGSAAYAQMARLLATSLDIQDVLDLGGIVAVERFLADAFPIDDVSAAKRDFAVTLSSAADILGELSIIRHRTTVGDSWAHVQDAVATFADRSQLLSDGADITEALVLALDVTRDLASAMQIWDSVVALLQGRIRDVSIGDTVALMSAISAARSRSVNPADVVEISDELLMLLKGRLLNVSIDDTLELFAGNIVTRSSSRAVSDVTWVHDELIAVLQGRISDSILSDGMLLGDAIAGSREFAVAVAEQLTVIDAALRGSLLVRLLSDSSNVSDAVLADIIRQLHEVLLADSLGITDECAVELVQLLVNWGIIDTRLVAEPISTRLM